MELLKNLMKSQAQSVNPLKKTNKAHAAKIQSKARLMRQMVTK